MKIMEHNCEARTCEYPGCPVVGLKDMMMQFAGQKCYCPRHSLLAMARHLVALYRVEGDVDWTAISEIIAEGLPELVAKAEAYERRRT